MPRVCTRYTAVLDGRKDYRACRADMAWSDCQDLWGQWKCSWPKLPVNRLDSFCSIPLVTCFMIQAVTNQQSSSWLSRSALQKSWSNGTTGSWTQDGSLGSLEGSLLLVANPPKMDSLLVFISEYECSDHLRSIYVIYIYISIYTYLILFGSFVVSGAIVQWLASGFRDVVMPTDCLPSKAQKELRPDVKQTLWPGEKNFTTYF